jgi:hypothetical protein
MKDRKLTKMQTLWWKPWRVELKGSTFYPIGPFKPYNPFAHYYPHNLKQTTRLTKSLSYEFLNVKADDQESVKGFCLRYGVLGRLDNPGWIMWGMEKSGSKEFLSALGLDELSPLGLLYEHDERGARLRKIAGIPPDEFLCVPMEWGDFRMVQNQLREAAEWVSMVASKRQSKANKDQAEIALTERFRWKLTMARPYLSPDARRGNWAFAWDIGSLEAALYLMLLSDLHGGGLVRNCLLCRAVFLGTTNRARFCSSRCLNTYKVRRFRSKRKKRVSKQPAIKEVLNGASGR